MNSKVTVLADEATGSVVNISKNNPDYGYIRVEQIRTMIDDNGFLRRKPVSALVPGTLQELQETGFFAGQQLDGKIIVQEALEPFNEKEPTRDLKVAGETGIVCTIGGLPIYRRTKMSFDKTAEDTLVKHDNVEELRQAFKKSSNVMTEAGKNTEFSIN
jgi:hypothetical protein